MTHPRLKSAGPLNFLQPLILTSIPLMLTIILFTPIATAQTFDSGSDGSDGALDYTPFAPAEGDPPVTVIFDPTNPATFDHPTAPDPTRILDPDGDNIYHFTTILIPANVTVRLAADTPVGARGSVYWLASGDVQIDGTIDLNGEDGHAYNLPARSSIAGTGGFNGGLGATSGSPPQSGFGPGGGQGSSGGGGGAGHAVDGGGSSSIRGTAYGNDFLRPLIGGSGGGGGGYAGNSGSGSGGGAGGGAVLIASSTSISVNGAISAEGGKGGVMQSFWASGGGGGGSGGAIRIIAPVITISGTGALNANGGAPQVNSSSSGSRGRIRLEAFQPNLLGAINPSPILATPGTIPFLPSVNQPQVRVVSVDGIAVPSDPTGTFTLPDVTINTGTPVTLAVEAHFIPLGTVVQLTLIPETGAVQTVDSTPLTGTLENSTATATVTIPAGLSLFTVQATWDTAN